MNFPKTKGSENAHKNDPSTLSWYIYSQTFFVAKRLISAAKTRKHEIKPLKHKWILYKPKTH